MMPSRYDRDAVAFMWKELEQIGVKPLQKPEDVEHAVSKSPGTTLLVVNSVCGCAAGTARPGIALALQNKKIPGTLATVFAGVDVEATQKARDLMPDIQPSSPSAFLFKDGQLVYAMHRHDIEGARPEAIAERLSGAFDKYCEADGPSVAPETVQKVFRLSVQPACGSSYEKD